MDVTRVGAVFCMVASTVFACSPGLLIAAEPSFYVSGMIGSSFATLTDSYHENYTGSGPHGV